MTRPLRGQPRRGCGAAAEPGGGAESGAVERCVEVTHESLVDFLDPGLERERVLLCECCLRTVAGLYGLRYAYRGPRRSFTESGERDIDREVLAVECAGYGVRAEHQRARPALDGGRRATSSPRCA